MNRFNIEGSRNGDIGKLSKRPGEARCPLHPGQSRCSCTCINVPDASETPRHQYTVVFTKSRHTKNYSHQGPTFYISRPLPDEGKEAWRSAAKRAIGMIECALRVPVDHPKWTKYFKDDEFRDFIHGEHPLGCVDMAPSFTGPHSKFPGNHQIPRRFLQSRTRRT